MKKQFLAITLLLSCVQVSKSMNIDHAGLALLVAGAATSRFGAHFFVSDPINALADNNTIELFSDCPNKSSFPTRVGSYVGITGKGVTQLTATALLMGGLGRLFPNTLYVPLATAAGLGATVLTVKAALGGHDQTKDPLRVDTVIKWTMIGAAAGTCYNKVPFVNNFVNGALGR